MTNEELIEELKKFPLTSIVRITEAEVDYNVEEVVYDHGEVLLFFDSRLEEDE